MTSWYPAALAATLTLAAHPLIGAQDPAPPPVGSADPYVLGQQIREAGDWRRALDIWEAAWDSLSFEAAHDPRIGIAYIETATANSYEAAYERASEMYLWGMAGPEVGGFAEVLGEEVARIEPLLPEDEKGLLPALLEARDPRLAFELKRFWIEADPTPSTRYNERLIEHWERIAYARERYTNGRYSAYDTDDRGEYYVRYGPPHKREAGTMGARESELQFWIRDLDDRNQLRRYDKSPAYEVWVYDDINDDEPVYLLFGQEDGSGRFRLLDGPADLIAPEAFSASTRRYTPGGIKAGFFLELFYYSEISSIGGPYGSRFDELDRAWGWNEGRSMRSGGALGPLAPPSEAELEAFKYRWEQEDRYAKTWVPEVPTLSEHDGAARFLNLRAWAFRSLSPENEPRVTVIALSAPRVDVERTDDLRRNLGVPDYTLGHTLIVRDERLQEVGRLPSVSSSARGDISVFPLRHVDRQLHFTVLTDTRSESAALAASGEPPARAYISTREPLDRNPGRLELSDLVTGVPPWEGIDAAVIPFPLVPSRSIWEEEGVRVYFEAYHLRPDPEGVHGMTADFVVRALDDEGEVTESPEPVTLSVDLEEMAPTARRSFDLDVRDLPVGRYRIDVTVADRVSGDRKTRTAEFEIVGR